MMSDVKLDRLSSILEGLAPLVTVQLACEDRLEGGQRAGQETDLLLFFLTQGSAQLQVDGVPQQLMSPALMAVRASQPFVFHRFSVPNPRRLMMARVQLTGPVATLFLEEFSQPRTVSLTDEEPALRWAVAMIESEMDAPRCGQPALLNRAGDILFIGLLRYLVAHPGAQGSGLFKGLADPRIAKALVAMHQRPAWGWDLELLAKEAGMSRTAFATKFHQTMRKPPGKYLSEIRLALAQRAVDSGRGLKEAAKLAGYGNSSALSRALNKSRTSMLLS